MRNFLANLTEKQFKKLVFSVLGFLLAVSLIMCSYLYISSLRTMDKAELLSKTATEVTSIAETLKATNGDLSRTAKMLRDHTSYKLTDSTLTFYYDENLINVSEPAAIYSTSVNKEKFDDYYSYMIRVVRLSDKYEIYKLDFKAVRERK